MARKVMKLVWYLPCLWRENKAMSIARKRPCLWRVKYVDAMSMAKEYDFWTRSWIPTLLCSFLPLACDWGPHGVDELLVFAWLRDQWCKECPQEMITTLEGRKSLEGLWALNFPAPVEEGLSWSLGFLSYLQVALGERSDSRYTDSMLKSLRTCLKRTW